MLVLTRRLSETVRIFLPDGEHIDITIVDLDRNRARIGIKADRRILIYRTELLVDGAPPPVRIP